MKAALCLLSDSDNGHVLSVDSMIGCHSVKDILLDKHPKAQPVDTSAIVSQSSSPDFHPISLTLSSALKTSGSVGLDASSWKCLCTSFQSSSDLCSALSSPGR